MDEVHRSCCRYAVTVENVTHIFVLLLPIMIFLIYFFVPHPLGKISMRKTEKIWGGRFIVARTRISAALIFTVSMSCSCVADVTFLGWPVSLCQP